MTLPAILRIPILVAALIVVTGNGVAGAASILVGVDGASPGDPEALQWLDQGETATLRIYLNLPDPEVASVFQADFDLVMSGSWGVTLDPITGGTTSEVNPGVEPFGEPGTWPNTEGSLTATRASISLTSNNLGGERLVAVLGITRVSDTPGDIFEVFLSDDPARVFVEMDLDEPPWSRPVDLTTALGTRLFVTPEPSTSLLLAAGLMGLAVVGRQRRI